MRRNRYPLLFFDQIGKRLSLYAFLILLFLGVVAGIDRYWRPFLGESLLYVWVGIGLAAASFFYFLVRLRRLGVKVYPDHLLVQGVVFNLPIPYDKVVSVTPSRLSKEHPMEGLSTFEWRKWSSIYDTPCALVALREYPAPTFTRRLLFPKFLFAQRRPGVLLLVKDWITLTKQIEDARAQWRLRRLKAEEPTSRGEDTGPIFFDETMVDTDEYPTVLLVDENATRRQQLKRLLENQFQLHMVQDGIEALQAARKHQPDLILMPPNPAKIEGTAMIQALRTNKELRDTPVILMVGREEKAKSMHLLEMGANDYLDLPFANGELSFRLNNWLRVRNREKELNELNDLLHAQTLDQMAELMRRGELLHFLPTTVAQEIMSGQLGRHQIEPFKRQKVTVLFVDIVGFTDLTGQLEPDTLSELLNEYLREMTAVANKFNGTVDKFIGDAVMVLFGAPKEVEEAEQAWQAAQAALEMKRVVEGLSMIWQSRIPRPLEVRLGFNTGFCTAGVFGNELLRSYTVVGSAVNIAARLQTAAQPNTIVCSAESYQHIKDRVHIRELGYLNLKGVNFPVEAYQLLELGRPYR